MTDVNDRATPEAKLPKGMIQLLPRGGAEPAAAVVSGRAAFPDMYDHSLLAGVPALSSPGCCDHALRLLPGGSL